LQFSNYNFGENGNADDVIKITQFLIIIKLYYVKLFWKILGEMGNQMLGGFAANVS